MPTSSKTTTKKGTTASRKKTTARRKTTTKKTEQQSIVTSMDKDQLIDGLKQTMKDVGKLPGMLLSPVITYVSTKYDSIPEARRKKLEEIVQSSKEQGGSVLTKMKDRFMERFNDAKETITEDTDKKPVKKRTPRKKTTTRSSTKKATVKTTATKKKPTTTKKPSTPRTKNTTPSKTTKTRTPRKTTTKKASE